MAKKVLDEMPKEETEKVSEKVAKKDSCDKKCGVKKFVLPAIIVVAIAVVGFVGFLGYRMIFGDDPVEITTNAIRGLKDTIKDAKDDSNGIYGLISNGDENYKKINWESVFANIEKEKKQSMDFLEKSLRLL